MLFLSYLWRKETAVLMTSAMAIFAASSVTMPNSSLSAENAANTPAAFLLRCRARGIDTERCREGFTRLKQQRGLDSARGHAAQIASKDAFENGSPSSVTEPMVGLIQDRLQVSASTEVLKAVDDMLGSLFDQKA